MKEYIFDKLCEYSKKPRYPFHMPGHKGGRLCSFSDVYKFDITEIDDFDNLHNASGIIKNSQERCSRLFGSDESFFMVNGSSGGNIASILATCGDGDKIIVSRNSHRSVFSGIVLSGAEPIYIYPQVVESMGIVGEILVSDVEKVFEKNPDAKAIFITSPTYEGFTADIKAISDIAHRYNSILIVDEAHGSHFKFNDYFPSTALECGADIVIQSVHKTLPSLTQTSVMHIRKERVDVSRLKLALSMVQSSSPSYIFISAMDKCCEFIETYGDKCFNDYVSLLEEYREKFSKLKNINLIGNELCGKYGICDYDRGKLVFFINSDDITTEEISKMLIEKYNIQLEAVGRNHIIAMTSVADTKDGFEALYKALYEIDKDIFSSEKTIDVKSANIKPIKKVSMRKAYFSQKERVSLEKSVGRVCGDFLIPYPPGIPLVCVGEVITKECLSIILEYIEKGITVMGIDEDRSIQVLV